MDKTKCITFDKSAQDSLPEHIKAKMKADREKARKEAGESSCDRLQRMIQSLRDSDVYIDHIFMRGGCYRFFLFLKTMYPNAEPYIHQDKDHIVTKLFGHLFDIRGAIEAKFESLYTPLLDDDLEMVQSWSFSKNQLLQLCECPHCEEPIIYNEQNNIIEKG